MKKIGSIVLFLVVLFGVYAFYTVVYHLLDKLNDLKLDPIRRSSVQKIDSIRYDAVYLGDSHAALWQNPMENSLNLGVSGQTSEQIRLRSDRVKHQLKGNKLIISLGDNDIACLSTNPERAQEVKILVIENLMHIVDNHRGHFNEIFVLNLPNNTKFNWYERWFSYPTKQKTKQIINAKLKQIAGKKNLRLIQVSEFIETHKDKEELTTDGVHFNQTTYRFLNQEIEKNK